ncbi:hypothetical protein SLS59_007925 [Nothophoma quercina]|uniref:Uncharacterized protein n=1 Tax=Nothophoma quercina TaxID=749835 RepID=A0ABR3QVN1_9PLEO
MPTSEWKLNPACNKWYREISDPATGAVLRYEYAQEDSNDAQASTAHVPQSTASHASTEYGNPMSPYSELDN